MAIERKKRRSETASKGQRKQEQGSQTASTKVRWVIAPNDNPFNTGMHTKSFAFLNQISGMTASPERPAEDHIPEVEGNGAIRVLDKIDLNETTLVEMSEAEALAMRRQFPGLRVEPERWLRMLRMSVVQPLTAPSLSHRVNASLLRITVQDSLSGRPIEGADVTVVFDQKKQIGMSGLRTTREGLVSVPLPPV